MRITGWALLAPALALWGPRPASADVADWALPDGEVSLVVRAADKIPQVLRNLDARFGETRAMLGAVARLQAFEFAGFHPLAGDWGGGLDPAAGIAVFVRSTPTPRMRFLVGIKDDVEARSALIKLASAAGITLEATADGFKVPPALDAPPDPNRLSAVKCAKRELFLVCDTEEAPATPPGRPTWLSADAQLEIYVRGDAVKAAAGASDAPVESFNLRWVDTPQGGRVETRTDVTAEARAELKRWTLGTTPVAGLDCLDARSGGVLKLSIDGPQFIQTAQSIRLEPSPEVASWIASLITHWSGDVVASFAGGLMHPVVVLGLRPGGDGAKLVRALFAPLTSDATPIEVTPDAIEIKVQLPPAEGKEPEFTTIRLRHGSTAQSLILGLAARDVQRCVRGELKPLSLPAPFAAKGRSGLLVQGPIGSTGSLPGLVEGPASWQVASDLMTVGGVALRLLGQVGFAVDLTGPQATLDIWWEVL